MNTMNDLNPKIPVPTCNLLLLNLLNLGLHGGGHRPAAALDRQRALGGQAKCCQFLKRRAAGGTVSIDLHRAGCVLLDRGISAFQHAVGGKPECH